MKGYLRYYTNRLLYYLTLPFRFIFRLPTEIVSAPRYILGLSLPMRVAVILAIFIPTLTIIAVIGYYGFSVNPASLTAYAKGLLGFVILLNIAIPIVAYYAVKLWLEPVASEFPEIDKAFQAGIDALKENNADLKDVPLFVILGAPDADAASTILKSAKMKLDIAGIPKGKPPLQWYVRNDAAFVVTAGLGCVSTVNQKVGSGAAPVNRPSSITQTLAAGAVAGGGEKDGWASGGPSDTAVANSRANASPTDTVMASQPSVEEEEVPAFASRNIRGTLVAGGVEDAGATISPDPSQPSHASPAEFDRNEANKQKEQLRHLCMLLKRQRQPLCTLNGTLILLPWQSMGNSIAADKLTDAVRDDLKTIQDATSMRFPVSTLVTGMETEAGFMELVRRVGVDVAKDARFGKGFDVRNISNAENLDALSSQACGSFETWVYDRFQRKDALGKQQGNGKLYSLLCRVRKDIHHRLRKILTRGVAFDGTNVSGDVEPHPFGGCYFAATGATEDKQAFVTSVFEKLVSLDEEIEWTEAAFQRDERYHQLAQVGMFFSGFLLVSLIALWIYVSF